MINSYFNKTNTVLLCCVFTCFSLSFTCKKDIECLKNMKIVQSSKGSNGKIRYSLYQDRSQTFYSEVFYLESGKIKKICCNVTFDTILQFDSTSLEWFTVVKRKSGDCFDYTK